VQSRMGMRDLQTLRSIFIALLVNKEDV
jgi:hypothetical protein